MNWQDRRSALRAILQGSECVETGCVFDPMSARIAEEFKVRVGLLSGSIASLVILGAPDMGMVTLSEMADLTYRVCRAGQNMPVLVDAESGFGNAISTIRAVEEFEHAGAAGILLEDDLVPEPFHSGTGETQSWIAIEEALGKVRAALMARAESGMVVIARTNALEEYRLDEALKRAAAYSGCGADAVMLGGRPTLQEVAAVADVVSVPLVVMSQEPADRLAKLGVRVVHRGQLPFRAAIQATYAAYARSLPESLARDAHPSAQVDLMERISSAGKYKKWAGQFLGNGSTP